MSNFIQLTFDCLNVNEILQELNSTSTGATAVFIGTTRDTFEGQRVKSLEYEAYNTMAVKKITQVCEDLRRHWDIFNVAFYHRLGEVKPGEASVVIAVSSKHRKSALKAVQVAIDNLKATVPIWKKEVYENGSEWKSNNECSWGHAKQQSDQQANLVQITASEEVIEARMVAFMSRKRSENDASNVQEYCKRMNSDQMNHGGISTCARIDSAMFSRSCDKINGRKTVIKTENEEEDAVVDSKRQRLHDLPSGISERVQTLEARMFNDNKPVPKDIYARLKAIEDRVKYLEGLSPEYFTLCRGENRSTAGGLTKPNRDKNRQEILDSLPHLNSKIQELRSKLTHTQK